MLSKVVHTSAVRQFLRVISFIERKSKDFYRFNLLGSGRQMTFLFNLRCLIFRKNMKVSSEGNFYKLAYDSRNLTDKRYFVSPKSLSWGYWNGVETRAQSLTRAYFLDQIEFNDGDLILDCGAHIGDFFLSLKNLAVDFSYVAFEPSPPEFECLTKNIPSPHVVHNFGLWDSDGLLQFYQSTNAADSSFIKPKKFELITKVQVKRIDQVESRKIKLLKLEAEGGELEVLHGAKGILRNIAYIAADLGFERGPNEENTIPTVVNFLLANKFELKKAIAPSRRETFLFRNTEPLIG